MHKGETGRTDEVSNRAFYALKDKKSCSSNPCIEPTLQGYFGGMSSPKKPRFLDFDFDFDLSMDKIFHASETSPTEKSPSKTNPHQPDLSRLSVAIGDLKRFSCSTGLTQDLPITPEPSISGKDVESSLSSGGEIASNSGDRDDQSTLPQSMTDYEAQTANSRGEVARQARRLRSVVDQESQAAGQPRQRDKSGKTLLFKVRVIGRIMQVFLR
jgi:hypothetical protein